MCPNHSYPHHDQHVMSISQQTQQIVRNLQNPSANKQESDKKMKLISEVLQCIAYKEIDFVFYQIRYNKEKLKINGAHNH